MKLAFFGESVSSTNTKSIFECKTLSNVPRKISCTGSTFNKNVEKTKQPASLLFCVRRVCDWFSAVKNWAQFQLSLAVLCSLFIHGWEKCLWNKRLSTVFHIRIEGKCFDTHCWQFNARLYLHLFRLRFLLLRVSAQGFLLLLVHLHLVLANKRYADGRMTSRGNKNW